METKMERKEGGSKRRRIAIIEEDGDENKLQEYRHKRTNKSYKNGGKCNDL